MTDLPVFERPQTSRQLGVMPAGSEVDIEDDLRYYFRVHLPAVGMGYVQKGAGVHILSGSAPGEAPSATPQTVGSEFASGSARSGTQSPGRSPQPIPAAVGRSFSSASGSSGYVGAELVGRVLFFVGWAVLVLGIIAAIGVAAAYDCQEDFLTDCSDEGSTKAFFFFAIAIGSVLYALPNFALSYTLKYLADIDARRQA
jgi:hypothetical protein